MGFASRGITSADILGAIVDDATKYSGADIGKDTVLRFYGLAADTTINATGANKALGSIAVPNISGHTIQAAYAGMILSGYENSGSLNRLDTTQYLQVDTGSAGWLTALTMHNARWGVAANGTFWSWLMGNVDVKAKVAFNATTDFQWALAKCDGASIYADVVSVLEVII